MLLLTRFSSRHLFFFDIDPNFALAGPKRLYTDDASLRSRTTWTVSAQVGQSHSQRVAKYGTYVCPRVVMVTEERRFFLCPPASPPLLALLIFDVACLPPLDNLLNTPPFSLFPRGCATVTCTVAAVSTPLMPRCRFASWRSLPPPLAKMRNDQPARRKHHLGRQSSKAQCNFTSVPSFRCFAMGSILRMVSVAIPPAVITSGRGVPIV